MEQCALSTEHWARGMGILLTALLLLGGCDRSEFRFVDLWLTADQQGQRAMDRGDYAEAALRFDLPVMFGATLACLPVFLTGHRVTRWEGAALLAYYAAYVAWLVLVASGNALRDAFGVALFGFALPLTAVGLIASLIAARRRRG